MIEEKKIEKMITLDLNKDSIQLKVKKDYMFQVEALIDAGWKFELPEIVNNWPKVETEPWQWYWRRPARKKNSKGQRFLSTNQAYNALVREISVDKR